MNVLDKIYVPFTMLMKSYIISTAIFILSMVILNFISGGDLVASTLNITWDLFFDFVGIIGDLALMIFPIYVFIWFYTNYDEE